MTDILCTWLNRDVSLSVTVKRENLASSFKNGFLFAEILYKYGLQEQYQKVFS